MAICPGSSRQNFLIRRSFDGEAYRFRLEPHDPGRPELTVGRDVVDDFETTGGRFVHVVPAILLTKEEMADLPTIEIVDETGERLWCNREQ